MNDTESLSLQPCSGNLGRTSAFQLQKSSGDDLMYRESSIVVGSIMALLDLGIVSYPVHDCLIVPLSRKESAIKILSDTIRENLGFVPAMDVAYFDDLGRKVETTISVQGGNGPEGRDKPNRVVFDWGLPENYHLIEDY